MVVEKSLEETTSFEVLGTILFKERGGKSQVPPPSTQSIFNFGEYPWNRTSFSEQAYSAGSKMRDRIPPEAPWEVSLA